MDYLFGKYAIKLRQTRLDFIRDHMQSIDFENNRLIGIKGARGVGKTTLVLQHLKQTSFPFGHTLYVSLDDLYFSKHQLYETAANFVKQGGKLLVLDEVHRYNNWSQEIKNLYDDFVDLKIIFTGSSLLHIERSKADLSRRSVLYTLNGMSFREYLQFDKIVELPKVSLNDLLTNHVSIAMEHTQNFRPHAHLANYLKIGFYPYFSENKDSYLQKLAETINLSLEIDLPSVYPISLASIDKIKTLLAVLAEIVPFKPNVSKLSEAIGISRNTFIEYLHYLEELGIISLLHQNAFGVTRMQKPEKVYLAHPNYLYALAEKSPNTGTLREIFALNHLKMIGKVAYTEHGDFKLEKQYSFEIGGKDKGRKQLADEPDAFVVADNIEIGFHKKIPLWMLGLLY